MSKRINNLTTTLSDDEVTETINLIYNINHKTHQRNNNDNKPYGNDNDDDQENVNANVNVNIIVEESVLGIKPLLGCEFSKYP